MVRRTGIMRGLWVSGPLCCVLLACSGKSPTKTGPTEMSTVYIGTSLITRITPEVAGIVGPDSAYTVSFGDVTWFDPAGRVDVRVTCSYNFLDTAEAVKVLDPSTSQWEEIDGTYPMSPGGCNDWGPCMAHPQRLLSQMSGLPSRFVDTNRGIRLSGLNVHRFTAQLIEYNSLYEFRTLRIPQNRAVCALMADGESVKYVSSYGGPSVFARIDTLFSYNYSGIRQQAVWSESSIHSIAAIGDDGIWSFDLGDTMRVTCRTGAGSPVHTFQAKTSDGRRPWSLVARGPDLWAVWYRDPGEASHLARVDIAASDGEGALVLGLDFPLEVRWCSPEAISWHGNRLLVTTDCGRMSELDSLGHYLRYFELPVESVSAIASDGETLWIAHHGPKGAFTDAILLTRFSLE